MSKEKNAAILLISDDKNIFDTVQTLLKDKWEVKQYKFSELGKDALQGDFIVIIDFDKERIDKEQLGAIIQIKGSFGNLIPVLAILPEKNPQDIFEVLKLGAFDYITRRELNRKLEIKVKEIIRWKWYENRNLQ
ncbi:response regulator transcription factor [[Ruminococcus] gnavus]|jgi:DNA-binding NtrC family response regulator|uniref:Stage 0 sporulation protein A homolog n=1 Tax=Mediterraneibacter gnavus TaxID=33038 RepID=A0AAJ1ERG9_MEDGN|nr:response regulator transcription factor [Mediterraneibacter gnavus]MCB5493668.1 hypothetical protein [Mediterraneibacter gnavus]MCB5592910.1 hypothetical protein [Mediterraneibacter gnavus]MCB5605635.1 hypothetical protein [Mediterraneibacter gnavus]MCG4523815.1 hypothetical protein [Mediterraneibacter gnavus]NSC90040.1 response regulator transcription factor [Mediterraneibacter gnavus]